MPGTDPITAVSNALSGLSGVAKPFVDEALAQKYDNDRVKKVREWQEIISMPPNDDRADAMAAFMLRLVTEAGESVGNMGGQDIAVIQAPVDFINALVEIAINKHYGDQLLAALRFKQG